MKVKAFLKGVLLFLIETILFIMIYSFEKTIIPEIGFSLFRWTWFDVSSSAMFSGIAYYTIAFKLSKTDYETYLSIFFSSIILIVWHCLSLLSFFIYHDGDGAIPITLILFGVMMLREGLKYKKYKE